MIFNILSDYQLCKRLMAIHQRIRIYIEIQTLQERGHCPSLPLKNSGHMLVIFG